MQKNLVRSFILSIHIGVRYLMSTEETISLIRHMKPSE